MGEFLFFLSVWPPPRAGYSRTWEAAAIVFEEARQKRFGDGLYFNFLSVSQRPDSAACWGVRQDRKISGNDVPL